MAKGKAVGRSGRGKKPAKRASTPKAKSAKKSPKPARRAVAKASRKASSERKASLRKSAKAKTKSGKLKAKPRRTGRQAARRPKAPAHVSRVERQRRVLEEGVPTPPSSLDMPRKGSAVRTGRAEIAEIRQKLGAMRELTGGDMDADAENAYFSGDEAPGGDNPTPDQDIVDDIGRAIGLAYQDNEELRSGDKVADRDRHRWELDPASSEDYKDRR